MNNHEALMPLVAEIVDIRVDTPDVKTFTVLTPDGKKPFDHMPGQCAMVSAPGRDLNTYVLTPQTNPSIMAVE